MLQNERRLFQDGERESRRGSEIVNRNRRESGIDRHINTEVAGRGRVNSTVRRTYNTLFVNWTGVKVKEVVDL